MHFAFVHFALGHFVLVHFVCTCALCTFVNLSIAHFYADNFTLWMLCLELDMNSECINKHHACLSILLASSVHLSEVWCGMLCAEVRYPNEVSPGDFLSAANVKTVQQNVAHCIVLSSQNVQMYEMLCTA